MPTTHSPLSRPMRPSMPSSTIASRISSAARSARSASSSCTAGMPKTAMTASPMNFSTTPPWRSAAARIRSKYVASIARTTSGSYVSPSSVESVTSAKSTVTTFRWARADSSTGGGAASSTAGSSCTRGAGAIVRVERGVLEQDRLLELLQRLARIEAELVAQRGARVLHDRERVGLAARAVERAHQQPAQALAQRVIADERFQLRHRLGVAADGEVGLEPVLERDQAQPLQPPDLVRREGLVAEVGERLAAPERERVAQHGARLLRPAGVEQAPALVEQLLEPLQIERAVGGPHDVAQRVRLDHAVVERLAQLRDVDLQRLDGTLAADARPRAPRPAARRTSARPRAGAALRAALVAWRRRVRLPGRPARPPAGRECRIPPVERNTRNKRTPNVFRRENPC